MFCFVSSMLWVHYWILLTHTIRRTNTLRGKKSVDLLFSRLFDRTKIAYPNRMRNVMNVEYPSSAEPKGEFWTRKISQKTKVDKLTNARAWQAMMSAWACKTTSIQLLLNCQHVVARRKETSEKRTREKVNSTSFMQWSFYYEKHNGLNKSSNGIYLFLSQLKF